MGEHSVRRLGIEEVRAVLQIESQTVAKLGRKKGEIEL